MKLMRCRCFLECLLILSGVLLWGCPSFHMRHEPRAAAGPTPAYWQEVHLESVELAAGVSDSGKLQRTGGAEASFYASPSLTAVVRAGLERRLGKSNSGPVALVVRDVTAVGRLEDGFALAGEVCLTRAGESSCSGIEHSVTVRGYATPEMWEKQVLTRAVEDFCDRILQDDKARQFLSGEGETVETVDSALLEREALVGPVFELEPVHAGYGSSGRVLWAPGDLNVGGGVAVTMGDVKGGMASVTFDYGGSWYSFKGLTAFGGFNIEDEEADISSTVFSNWSFLAALVGHNGTNKEAQGYVHSPGVSFLLGPQVLTMRYFSSDFDFNIIEGGGMVVLDLPLGTPKFGLTGGYWAGVAGACVSAWGGDTGYGAWCSDPMFIHAPVFDLWVRTGSNRFNLGLQFLALAAQDDFSVDQLWKNPTVMFTWMRSHGRGVGSSDSSLKIKGRKVFGSSENLATPVNVFERD
jgi:hypothetical protein